ncbi:hypothetical protein NQ317_005350 [Molorchus minor]|uniref:Uncharacterized protein n=1 Tax=Molorchus minor TaxID=1323400 RepID=A0ABQ9JQS4_9CUCU|nr:hypothetical protein NQ317_005350 [Molorchus minor]
MRSHLVVIVFAALFCASGVTADGELDIASLLKIGLRFVLLNIRHNGNVTITDNTTIELPDAIKNISCPCNYYRCVYGNRSPGCPGGGECTAAGVLHPTSIKAGPEFDRQLCNLVAKVLLQAVGTLGLQNAHLYGFNSMDITTLTTSNLDTPDDNTKTTFLGISTNYDADIGILDEIPIYGDGEINLAVSNVNLGLDLNINTEADLSVVYVDEVTLTLRMHDSTSYITRFWKNDEISDYVSLGLMVLEQLICMFISYEDECFSCVTSKVLQYAMNSILPNNLDNNLVLDCACLDVLYKNKYNLSSHLERVIYLYQDNKAPFLNEEEVQNIRGLFVDIIKDIMTTLHNRGLTFEF